MGPAVDLLEQAYQEDEAHEHLHRDCPFFRHVGEGGRDEVDGHCRYEGIHPGPLVKLTPRTPEASTVHQPTVPPGGPGLFHVKGLQLPAYVQHLYKHLVGRYGKHDAYRVTVGVVKKWAQGIHPGGRRKGGKQGRVHADVQAAAARNVAEWESDKAAGHQRGGREVKATAAPASCTGQVPPAAALSAVLPPQAQAQYGISPRPPLPPRPELPRPAEVRALAALVPGKAADAVLSGHIRRFLETAAVKLEKDTPLEALAALRGAEAAVYATHRKDITEAPPFAWGAPAPALAPGGPSRTPAALAQREQALGYRRLQHEVGSMADRIRKNYYGGGIFSGPSSPARLSARLR